MGEDQHTATKVVHAGVSAEPVTGSVMTPIFQTSTYQQKEPGVHNGFDYSRADNPTRQALEQSLASLEGAAYGLAFSSGLAAEQAIIQLLEPPCKVLVCDDVYGGTGRLFRRLFAKYGIEFVFADLTDETALKKHLSPDLRMVWIESPTNPLMKILPIRKIKQAIQGSKALLVVDNTFASPIFQSPLNLGADIVVHSTTKYIGGHSDLIGGALMTRDAVLFEQLKFIQFAAGAVPSPFESFLLLRSIKTLELRMQRHVENAQPVAEFLEKHPKVLKVLYPGLKSHPQHMLAKEQMSGFSGMISFYLDATYPQVLAFLKALKIFSLAESLGGVESLINHPERMTHASVPEEQRKILGISENLLRISVGIEDKRDLIADLENALSGL